MRFARRLRRIIVAALFVLVVFVMGALITRQPGNPDLFPPKPGEAGVTAYVVAYVYHSGLALPIRRELGSRSRPEDGARSAFCQKEPDC
jgi:hypothetical protein